MKKQYNIPQIELLALVQLNAICDGSKPFVNGGNDTNYSGGTY